jgi:hypothetical protein
VKTTVTNQDLEAQIIRLMRGVDVLDRAVTENRITCGEALEKADTMTRAVAAALTAAGAEMPPEFSPSFADPVSLRVQARRQRIAKSGLRLIAGGA